MLKSLIKSVLGRQPQQQQRPQSASPAPAASLTVSAAPGPVRERYVAFVTASDRVHRFEPGQKLGSSQASLRLRVQIPGRELSRSLACYAVPTDKLLEPDGLAALGQPAAIVIGKVTTDRVQALEPQLRALLSRLEALAGGTLLVADLADDYAAMAATLGVPFLEEYQRELGRLCVLTVPCEALRIRLASIAKQGIHVVEDPWESPRTNAPCARPGEAPRLAWFGYLSKVSMAPVEAALLRIAERFKDRPLRLDFLAQGVQQALATEMLARVTAVNPQFDARFIPWAQEAAWRAIDDCDFVLLPQEVSGQWTSVKSHNRLVEAIRGGRLALASPIPSYVELKDFAWVGEDLAEGLEWALANPDQAERRVAAGQAAIPARFSPEAVGERWGAALGVRAGPVKLNLGCGDKILPGYVNVDIAESRNGKRPDVLCDLRKLEPFADASADEVMAIHVVEHLWRWEAAGVLREWLRVLRPGGRMVLECPNLLSACQAVLDDPAGASGPGFEGQRSMWVLYGDPRWQDPLMCHRWSYTPASLSALMQEAGMVNVRQEPAQFKAREPRDMRIVGEKPIP